MLTASIEPLVSDPELLTENQINIHFIHTSEDT